jgi:hypothetical protein
MGSFIVSYFSTCFTLLMSNRSFINIQWFARVTDSHQVKRYRCDSFHLIVPESQSLPSRGTRVADLLNNII